MNCPHFGQCGGCAYPHQDFWQQLADKFQKFRQEITPVLGPGQSEILLAPRACVNQLYYRNKMEFAFGQSPDGQPLLGLRRKRSFREVVNLDDCLLFGPGLATTLNLWRNFIQESNRPVYNLYNHQGFWRYLVMRKSFSTNQWLNILITTTPENNFATVQQKLEQMFKKLKSNFPPTSGLVWLLNDGLSDTATGKIFSVFGQEYLTEEIAGKTFLIHSLTFFQINPPALNLLIQTINDWVKNISYRQRALDLYCGVGLLSLFLADWFGSVSGVELNPQSIQSAIENARVNNQKNVGFFNADVYEYLKKGQNNFDLIVVDPPRAGLGKKVIEQLLKTNSPTIIYVSCNPRTLADDLKIFTPKYKIKKIQPIDFFPYTPHLESVTLLTL